MPTYVGTVNAVLKLLLIILSSGHDGNGCLSSLVTWATFPSSCCLSQTSLSTTATAMSPLLFWSLGCSLVTLAAAQMNFFAASGEVAFDNPVSSACSTALNSTLQCESRWTMYPNNDFSGPFNTTELDGFCAPTCTSSLAAYRSQVVTSCKNDQPFEDIHAAFVAERMIAYQNRTCLKDETTGNYCNGTQVLRAWRDKEARLKAHFILTCLHGVAVCLGSGSQNVNVAHSRQWRMAGSSPGPRHRTCRITESEPLLLLLPCSAAGHPKHTIFELR